jgi:hypothetical protein
MQTCKLRTDDMEKKMEMMQVMMEGLIEASQMKR